MERKREALEKLVESLKIRADREEWGRKLRISNERAKGRRADPALLEKTEWEKNYAVADEVLVALKSGWSNADEMVAKVLDAHAAKDTGDAGK